MPLRHSPPRPSPSNTPGETTVNKAVATTLTFQTYDSDTASERSGNGSVSIRTKRRRDQEDIGDLKHEMRELFSQLSTSVEQQFQAVKQQNTDLKESLQFMSDKYDAVLEKVRYLEEERAQDKKNIYMLEEKLEAVERKIRSTGLEIRNMPKNSNDEKRPESKSELCNLIKSLSKTVNINLEEEHIRDIYRTSSKNDTLKPLIVEFTSVLIKEDILRAVKNFNKDKTRDGKLNTNHLNISGPVRPVYVSETLTFKTQRLFYMSREFARDNYYSYCWTSRGSVYLRKTEGQSLIRIQSESDLTKLMKNKI